MSTLLEKTNYCISISPIEEFSDTLLDRINSVIQNTFFCQTEVVRLLTDIEFAMDPKRGQYHSTAILKKLEELAPPHAIKVLAITRMDLFIPILTHVYGEAQLGGKTSIVSIHRLGEGLPSKEEAYLERVAKEAIHELGHTFNLIHCKDSSCIMHYCRDIKDVDRKSNHLCRYCRILLEDEMKRMKKRPSK